MARSLFKLTCMKINSLFVLLCCFTLQFLASCSKNSPQPSSPIAPTSTFANRAILYECEIALPTCNSRYYFLNLAGTNNAEKKFFKARLIDVVKDSFEIMEGPYSLDSLVSPGGLPSNIQSACSGTYLTDFIHNDNVRVRQTGAVGRQRSFSTSEWLGYGGVPGSLGTIQSFTKGKQIQGFTFFDGIKLPNGTGGYQAKRIFYFFKDNLCLVDQIRNSTSGSTLTFTPRVEPISSAISGSPDYDWTKVDNCLTYNVGGSANAHIFLDYTNWRYFKIEETFSGTGPSAGVWGIEFHGYKSLDKLLKWPAGWKK